MKYELQINWLWKNLVRGWQNFRSPRDAVKNYAGLVHGLRKFGWMVMLALAACAAPVTPTVPPPTLPATPTPAPSATLAFTPTVAATATVPTFTPEPILRPVDGWNVPAQEMNSDLAKYFLRWQDDKLINAGSAGSLNIESKQLVTATAIPTKREFFSDSTQNYSPGYDYVVRCNPHNTQVFDVASSKVLLETDLLIACDEIDWRFDSLAMAFPALGKAYVWHIDGKSPQLVVEAFPPYAKLQWSPDGTRLSYAYCDFDAEKAFAVVISATGEVPNKFEITGCGVTWDGQIYWWTHEVLVEPLRYGSILTAYEYYAVRDGRKVGTYIESIDFPSQRPQLSFNRRWHVVDETNGNNNSGFIYTLYSLDEPGQWRLSDSQTTQLQFVGWATGSQMFYTISRPVSETAQASAGVPFGLLALNPQTRTFTQLFEQAVFAKLSPDQTRAWVVFPTKREDGTVGLDGGVFDLAAGTLAARQNVADEVYYGNPVEGALLPAAWNHAGTRLVFADAQGGLTLVNVNGETQTLTASLPTGDEWRRDTRLEWSPDDARLLVQSGARAWVVEVP